MQKDWKNISDEELDKLFRDSAERHHADFEPDSWNKMNQKMDAFYETNTEKESSWKRLIPLLLLLLLGSVGGYFWLNNSEKATISEKELDRKDESTKNQKTENIVSGSEKTIEKGSEKTEINSLEKTDVAEEKIKSEFVEPTKTDSKETAKTENNESEFKKNNGILNKKTSTSDSEKLSNTNSENKNTTVFSTEKNNLKFGSSSKKKSKNSFKEDDSNFISKSSSFQQNSKFLVNSQFSKTDNQNDLNNNFSENKLSNSTQILSGKNETKLEKSEVIHNSTELSTKTEPENLKKWELWGVNNELKAKGFIFKSDWKLPEIKSIHTNPSKTQTNDVGIPFKKGWNIRLNLSPDLSTINFNAIAKIGVNYGALIEYRFNRRMSIQTGVIRSTKLYDALPEQYTWIWRLPNTPLVEINATCKMLDFPINLRYDITQKTDRRWFVSLGTTSYKMLNELYVYNYVNPLDPTIKWRKWAGNSGNYNFKVINLSTGYEWQVKKKMSLQVEPFAKLPTEKIGFGKVKLMTFGVFFSGKYHIGK